MSGTAGVYFLDGRPVELSTLQRMVESLAHRGPNGANVWHQQSTGLGHCLLWATPESLHEQMPRISPTRACVITADARIDNRAELAKTLGLGQRPPTELTDSEVILHAYERWGEGCPEHLLGDYAFAIWDGERQRLFCARDPMGVKPFYYIHRPHRLFAFASEIKALLCLPEVPRRLNEVRVADYLARFFEDSAITFYQDIVRLPAAHRATVSATGLHSQRYWALDTAREVRLRTHDEYADAFRELFTEAVHCRLRSPASVGSALSGGLDSSSVACTARNGLVQQGDGPLHTYSAIFPTLPQAVLPRIDERPYMAAVLATGGFEAHSILADQLSPLGDYDRILWHMDEPVRAPNLYLHWALYRAAHAEGNRVFLDGIDGDSTVSHGLAYLAELAGTGRWRTLFREAAALSRRSPARYSPWRMAWEFGFRPLVPDLLVRGWRIVGRRPVRPPVAADGLVQPAFAQRIGLSERVAAAQDGASRAARNARTSHAQGLETALHAYALELADRAAAAFALEPRYPFFDRRLLEFCVALPGDQKLHDGWTRAVLRRAMAGILPPLVQWRTTKANLGPNFALKLREYERETLDGLLRETAQPLAEYVNLAALRAIHQRYIAQPGPSEQDALALYSVAVLARWLRLFSPS